MKYSVDSVPVSLRLPGGLYQHLKRVARQEAMRRDADVSYADLIREALVQSFPLETEAEELGHQEVKKG